MQKSIKTLIVLAFVLAFAANAFANIFTVGPFSGYMDDYDMPDRVPVSLYNQYGWSKFLYTASELTDAGLTAGPINGIGFKALSHTNPAKVALENQHVYIRNIGINAYDDSELQIVDHADMQHVFSGNVMWHQTHWQYVMFDTPFVWDGVSSIEVQWENHSGLATSARVAFDYQPTYGGGYKTVHAGADASFPAGAEGMLGYFRPSMSVITPMATAPDAATHILPADGSITAPDEYMIWKYGAIPPTSYNLYLGTTPDPAFLRNQKESYFLHGNFEAGATYYWKVVPENENGLASDCPVWSFSIPGADDLAESFEEVLFPPLGWMNLPTTGWSRYSAQSSHGSFSAYRAGSASVQYTLSTPMLEIDLGDVLTFDYRTNNANGFLEIVYSEDRENWTLLETVIPTNEGGTTATNTWQSFLIDLTPVGGLHYLGFRTSLNAGARFLDNISGPKVASIAPHAPVLDLPADMAINQPAYPTLEWSMADTGGIPTGYDLYLDTVDGSTLFATNVNPPYTLTESLEYDTTYYWTVKAVNGEGVSDHPMARSFTTMPAINTFPWEEDFGTAAGHWLPTFWKQSNSVYPAFGSTTANTWARFKWLYNGVYNAARFTYNSTPAKAGWLVTPPIHIPADAYELKFDLALSAMNSINQFEGAMHESQIFRVVMSDTPNMDNPVILREWNSTGSPYAITGISHLGEEVVIPLEGVTGIKFFAFYAETLQKLPTPSAPDLYLDNVGVRERPITYPIVPDVDTTLVPNTTATISPTGGAFLAGAYEDDTAPTTPIPNSVFVPSYHKVWRIVGTGMINLTISTAEEWFAYVVGGEWQAQEVVPGTDIIIPIDLGAKDSSFEFALGGGGNPTLPVELSYFNAVFVAKESSVNLSWRTESEMQMLGYNLYRAQEANLMDAKLITPKTLEATNSSTGGSYSFRDADVENGTYYYWLEAVSYNSSEFYGYQSVIVDFPSAPELPTTSTMSNAYPNPFKGKTNIDITVKAGESGSFTIYNMLGQAVYSKKLSEGNITVEWNGRDMDGNRCGNGVYFYKLNTPSKSETKKMLIVK